MAFIMMKYGPGHMPRKGSAATRPSCESPAHWSVARHPPPTDLTVYVAYILAGFRAARADYPLDSYLSPRGQEVLRLAERLDYFDLGTAIGTSAPRELGVRVDHQIRSDQGQFVRGPGRNTTGGHGGHGQLRRIRRRHRRCRASGMTALRVAVGNPGDSDSLSPTVPCP